MVINLSWWPLDDAGLAERRAIENPLVAEPGQIDRLVSARQEQLGHGPAAARCMHAPVAREPRQEMEVSEPAGGADDHGAVEVILVVEPRQRARTPRPLELREAVRQSGPDDPLGVRVVDVEVVAAWLDKRRDAAGVAPALRPECESLRVLDVWQWLYRLLRKEEVLEATERLYGDLDVHHGADVLGPGTGGVDEVSRLDSLAGSEQSGSYGRAMADESSHIVGHELGTNRAGLVPKAYKDAVGIEPSIVWRQNRRAEVVDVHRREPAFDFIGFEPLDVASEA